MKGWACIARLGGIGDNLIASVVLRPLKRMGYMVEVIASETASAVFLNNPFIDKLAVKREGDLPGGNDWHKWFASRAHEYDLFVNLSNSCETRHALHYGNTAFHWPVEYRRKLCAGSYLDTACEIVGVPFEPGPLYFPTEEERANAEVFKRANFGPRFVSWVISGSRVDKIHPYGAMAIARIIKEMNVPVVMTGIGDQQKDMADQMREHVVRQNGSRDGVYIAISHSKLPEEKRWGLRPSLALLLQSDLVITPDTGSGWAVAMEPMPKIMTVSHASVENITKHWVNTVTLHADQNRVPCWPCHRLHDDISTCVPNKDGGHAAACISDISVETILDTVRKLLMQQQFEADTNVRVLREAAE